MERLSDFEESKSPCDSQRLHKRDSFVLSEMGDNTSLSDLLPELVLIPYRDPPEYNIKNIITNPIAFKNIIKQFGKVSSVERVENINNILDKFRLCLHNNIIINNPMNYDKYPIDLVKLLLGAYFSDYSKEDPDTRCALLKLIRAVTIGGRFSKSHFESVYGYITSKDPDDLLGAVELIENMIAIDKDHIPMFYFSDIDSYIEISSSLTIDKSFKNGITIGFWFRIEELNGTSFEDYPSLFTIFCAGSGGFEAYFEGNVLYYKTMSGKSYQSGPDDNNCVEVFEFEPRTWYSLFICHKKKNLKILVNGQHIKTTRSIEYPKNIDSGRLDKGFLCRKMTGQVSSILICSDCVELDTAIEICSRYPKSVQADKLMKDFEEVSQFKDDKLKEKIFGLYIPSRAYKNTKGEIFVEFCNYHRKAKLSSHAGVFCQDNQKNQLLFCGDVKALLPIMPLFQRIEDVELGRKTFSKFLSIIETFTHLLTEDNIKEFHLEGFSSGFFLLFYSIPLTFFTKDTIQSLIDIRFNLKKDFSFFNHMMYTTDIWINLDFEIQHFFWDYVNSIYSQDYKVYLKFIDIKRLLQIVKHLVATKRGHCCEKHERIKDPRSARKSSKYLPVNNLSEYIRPILEIIRNILSDCAKGAKETSVTSGITDLVSIITYKQTPCYRIEVLKVIKDLVSEQEQNCHTFKVHLKKSKHYFLILKVFNESYYDVQTYCAEIIKCLDLDQSIKEKIFSFMNYSLCPPDQRDIDVSLEDMTAYHTPVFKKNQYGNILDHTEQMRSQSSLYRAKKYGSALEPSQVLQEHEEMKYESSSKVKFKGFPHRTDSKISHENLQQKFTDPNFSEDNSEEYIMFTQSRSSKYQSSKEKIEEETKNSEESLRGADEEDPLGRYLKKLEEKREVKESPVISDDNRIEVNPHRKSGKSSSPKRDSVPGLTPSVAMIKESTNIPLTSSLSSEGNNSGANQEVHAEEDFIIEELGDLYQVFLSWIFSSRDECDTSRPIKYNSVLPLCLNLAAKSTKLMKQKVISDLNFMTVVAKNANIIMTERTFPEWIIELIFTVFPSKKVKDLDPIWDMGCKLYIQMAKMCLNNDSSSHSNIHQLIIWPISKYLKSRSTKEKIGSDIKKRERMVRTILCGFFDTISSSKDRDKWNPSFSHENPFSKFWKNTTQIVFQIEELVLSFEYLRHIFSDDANTPIKTSKNRDGKQDFSFSLPEMKEEQSIYANTKNYLFISSVKNTWHDSQLLNLMFEIIEPIWLIKIKRRSSKVYKSAIASNFKNLGYNQIEDQVLDTLDEISSRDANERLQILLSKKVYSEEFKKKERHNFSFIKTVVNLICLRITLEQDKNYIIYYLKMLCDITECCIFISECWSSKKSDDNNEVQSKLTKVVAFVMYFLHREIRSNNPHQEYLCNALDNITTIIFVIALKKYAKDHEHADPKAPSARLVTRLLNGYFEKTDKTLLFIRKDLENYQAKDYQGISQILCSDQFSDFFDESERFRAIKREFCKENYCEIVSKERYSYAKKIRNDQRTWDYQEKKKYQEISIDISDKHDRVKVEEDNIKKETLLWIDSRQRMMKRHLRKIYNSLFLWNGVWRNKQLFDDNPEEVPLKAFNFITKNLTKPILKNYPSQGLCYYNDTQAESILKRPNIKYPGDNWRLLKCDDVFEDKIYINLKDRFFSRKISLEEMKLLDSCYISFLEKFIFTRNEKDNILGEYKCTQLTPMYSKAGKILTTKRKLVFIDSVYSSDLSCSDTYGNQMLDFFTYKKKPYKMLYSTYLICDIQYAFNRKFLFEHTCVDLIFTNCESLTLNFKSKEECNKFLKHLTETNPATKTFLQGLKKSKATEWWQRGEISTSFYLMLLNYLSSRSYNDLSQYPIIPWFIDEKLLTGKNLDEVIVRDFEKNLIKLGCNKRLEQAVERYEEDCFDQKYHSGSYHSNPGIILQYLVRIPPFCDGLIKFQSGKLDCADRMFSDIAFSYHLALNESLDVRELIPETIFLPEMYKNHLKINFGETQDGQKVDQVFLPEWAKDDPYQFTCKFKEIFESSLVSDSIHQWFDLVFGYKQLGKEAEEACNTFPALSYEGGVDMTDPENIATKDSIIIRLYNFGQCPTQLLSDPHPKREDRKEPLRFIHRNADLQAKPIDLNKQKYGDIKEIKFVNDSQFYMIYKKNKICRMIYNEYLVGGKKPLISECPSGKMFKIQVDPLKIHFSEFSSHSSSVPVSTILVKNGLRLLIGGYWDGMMVIQNFTNKEEISKKKHLYRITMIQASQSEEIVITGTEKGDVAKWNNNQGELKYDSHFFHHQSEVTGCCICENMGVFATCSKDGTANLYVLSATRDPSAKGSKCYILRTFKQPDNLPLSKVLISESPLASIILLTEDLKCMSSFSINGKYLSTYEDITMIENPMVIPDENFNDKLIYGNTTGKLGKLLFSCSDFI
ncbi:unnamed protein product [Moneuplotes crassus]|uniref:Uncharacterized protein n=1 Tax=Euplotes crassus TaxID=5936 RepID=A0AAD1XH70_EUPCR|nr:unnamed protein product [Moneuplotes crassus]